MCLLAFSRTQTHFSKEPKCFLAYRKLIMDPSHKLFRSLTNWRNVAKKKLRRICRIRNKHTHSAIYTPAWLWNGKCNFSFENEQHTFTHAYVFFVRFFICSCPEGAKARSISKSQRNNKQFEQSAMFQFHVNHIANASDASIYNQTTETITFAFGCHLFHKSMRYESGK